MSKSCDVAYYTGTDFNAFMTPPPAKSFTKEKRDGIISLGVTDNPCDKIYNNLKKPSIKGTKSFGSGPPRFSDNVSWLLNHIDFYHFSQVYDFCLRALQKK